jgi:Ca2+-binding EF-hand superfamily protein
MQHYTQYSVKDIKKIQKKFEQLQTSGKLGFGWGIDYKTFTTLFTSTAPNVEDSAVSRPSLEALWAIWDSDKNGVTDVLEILGAMNIICRGKTQEKLEAIFSLFDFDENNKLTHDETAILLKTCCAGLCRLQNLPEPNSTELDKFCVKAGARQLERAAFITFVENNPAILGIFNTFAAKNSKTSTGSKLGEAEMKTQTGAKKGNTNTSPAKSSKSLTATLKLTQNQSNTANSGAAAQTAIKFSLPLLRKAKSAFDSLDKNKTGTVMTRAYASALKPPVTSGFPSSAAAHSANINITTTDNINVADPVVPESLYNHFKNMENRAISFEEIIVVFYPAAKKPDLSYILACLKPVKIGQQQVLKLAVLFESLDENFDGKNTLSSYIGAVREEKELSGLIKYWQGDLSKATKLVLDFKQSLIELFGISHHNKMPEILGWAAQHPIHSLNKQQHGELEQLFSLYDTDHSGTINVAEVRQHFHELGFKNSDVTAMFEQYDVDGSNSVDLQEFKKFYRNVWDKSQRAEMPMVPPRKSAVRM